MTEVMLREQQAANYIHGICLKNGPAKRVGVELEWLVRDARDPALPVPAERIAAAVAPFCDAAALPSSAAPGVLPSGASLTTEPGGQLELSSLPADTLADCVRDTEIDLAALRAAAADADLTLAGVGLDPFRSARRILDLPRYAAMEEFFDRDGPWGRQMMCSTASVQVCLDAGDDSDTRAGHRWRWRFLHTIGPVLVGAFANSPLRNGRPTGWRSSRQQVWAHMDAGRTRPPRLNGDLRTDWATYALDAQVMCVRSEGDDWSAPPGLTLRDWVHNGSAADGKPDRAPASEDLDYHLSTLFPPVRPRGHFEIRMIDAQPGDGWVVPLAVVSALLADEPAAQLAMTAAERIWLGRPPGEWPGQGDEPVSDIPPDSNPWLRAAMSGPADPGIGRASRECFDAARDALTRQRVPAAISNAVDSFIDEYVRQDRCPADDLLEEST